MGRAHRRSTQVSVVTQMTMIETLLKAAAPATVLAALLTTGRRKRHRLPAWAGKRS